MSNRRKPSEDQRDIEWEFFSFPPAFALAAGALIATVLIGFGLIPIVFILSMFGTSFGIAHIVSHWFQRRHLGQRRQQAEQDERERRALAARQAAAQGHEPPRRRRRRRRE